MQVHFLTAIVMSWDTSILLDLKRSPKSENCDFDDIEQFIVKINRILMTAPAGIGETVELLASWHSFSPKKSKTIANCAMINKNVLFFTCGTNVHMFPQVTSLNTSKKQIVGCEGIPHRKGQTLFEFKCLHILKLKHLFVRTTFRCGHKSKSFKLLWFLRTCFLGFLLLNKHFPPKWSRKMQFGQPAKRIIFSG